MSGSALLVGVTILIMLCGYLYKRHITHTSLAEKIESAILYHKNTLVTRRAQLVYEDAHGQPQVRKWVKEIEYFIKYHASPLLSRAELRLLERYNQNIIEHIERTIKRVQLEDPVFRSYSENMSPAEFETFCAEQLRGGGWIARVAGQPGDQGADVVAEKNGVVIAVQCKKYTRPVGNKAVQEAAAARAHQNANYGIVVTNNKYTKAAEHLAKTNNVFLLHFRDLKRLYYFIRDHRQQ